MKRILVKTMSVLFSESPVDVLALPGAFNLNPGEFPRIQKDVRRQPGVISWIARVSFPGPMR